MDEIPKEVEAWAMLLLNGEIDCKLMFDCISEAKYRSDWMGRKVWRVKIVPIEEVKYGLEETNTDNELEHIEITQT